MIYKYNLQFIGLGDLTFFCGEMMCKLSNEDILEIKIDESTLINYRNGSSLYKKFCFDYIKYILSDYNVLECQTEPEIGWTISLDFVDRMLKQPEIKKKFQEKFSSGIVDTKYQKHIILFTKVRDYPKSEFDKFSEKLFNHLNLLDSKIVLIGEKNICYQGENGILGKEIVYSLYDEYIKNITNEKIIDLTKKDYSPDSISLKSIIDDLTLISHSKKIIMIGGGGFFCTSLLTDKLLSITTQNNFSKFNLVSNQYVFEDYEKFLEMVKNI